MGTIVIEEYQGIGTQDNSYAPVYRLEKLVKRTADATTSTTAESITLQAETTFARIYTAQIHRLGVTSASTDNSGTYITTEAGKWIDIAVKKGGSLFYRTDA